MLEEYLPYIIIVVIAGALIAATIVLARLAWRRQMTRYLMDLVGRREAVRTAFASTEAVVQALAGRETDDLVAFAEGESEDRTTFVEIATRMRIEASELEAQALPKRLWPLANALGEAAGRLAAQAGAVGDATGLDSIEGLAELDLEAVRVLLVRADEEMDSMLSLYGLADATMYSGVDGHAGFEGP